MPWRKKRIRKIPARTPVPGSWALPEARFQAVFDVAAEGILMLDLHGKILYANKTAHLLLGSSDNLKKVSSVPDWFGHARRAAEENCHFITEDSIRQGDTHRQLEASWVPVLNEKGVVDAVSCVYRDVTERNRMAYERRLLAQSLLDVQEQERKNISDFLHDHMGPLLIMAKMELEQLARAIPVKKHGNIKGATSRLDEALRGIRHQALLVRPPLIDDLEVKDALEFLVEDFVRTNKVHIQLAPVPRIPALGPALKNCLYRVLQEALQNVAMHSGATSTSVKVEERNNEVVMTIRDNGVGFDPSSVLPGKRLGLIGMREIVDSLGGKLNIRSQRGSGTIVEVRCPAQESEELV